ncbi:MAG: hypothetical protein COA57_06260 [Flavobacteriales bacterium]|nr:MAG: hypothetical protein COA57_06260 [Flavobacteriales bacterium]
MSFLNNTFFSPLTEFHPAGNKKSKNLVIIWFSVIVLLTVALYEGHTSFFIKHFGHHFEAGPLLDWYKWGYHHLAVFVLWFIVPVLLIKAWMKEKTANFGMQLGDWKFGLKATLVAFLILPIGVYISSFDTDMQAQYPLTTLAMQSPSYFALWGLVYLPYYIGWEFLFRGYVGIGMRKYYGAFTAIMIQTVLSTIMHIGKPEGETWGAVVGGIYLGLLTYRTNSILWALLFHWYLGMINTYFCGIH